MEIVPLRPKTYNYLSDNNDKNKKAKSTKMFNIERKLKLGSCKSCLKESRLEKQNKLARTK